jgi:hypothetical protein
MSFALPSAFWLAACAVPIIVFYILKVRLRRQPVSTNLFWKQIYDEKPPRSIWQYLRHLLSLLAQLALLALLVLAIADPYLPWQLLQARRIVAVIDRSASMRAGDVAPSRFEAAIDAARTFIDGLRFRDEMAIVVAGPRPEVVIGMSSHVPTLKRALRGITVSDNPTDLAASIELGKQLIGNHPRGQVLVYTDGCVIAPSDAAGKSPDSNVQQPNAQSTTDSQKPPTPVITYHTFGTRAANVGITQLQVRRSLVDPLGYEVLASVTNAADHDAQCRLELELDGVPVDVIPLRLKANETWRRSLQKTSIEGGTLVARLTQIAVQVTGDESKQPQTATDAIAMAASANALIVDDTAWAILPPRKLQRVLLVTEGNLFLQKVFEANPLVQCEVRKDMPATWPADAIVVLHRQVPPELPPGDVFVVDPTGSSDAWDLGAGIENPIITQQEADSPLMTHVRLDNVVMPQARRISFKATPQVLAGTLSGDAVYAAVKRDHGKCLVLSVDLDQSDLAFRTAFPIMVTNALGWFRGDAGELRSSVATGQIAKYLPEELKLKSSSKLILRSPSGREFDIAWNPTRSAADRETQPEPDAGPTTPEIGSAAPAPEISLGPLDECGVWTLVSRESADEQTTLTELSVNLANERESDLRPPEEQVTDRAAASLAANWLARPLWFYIVAVACAMSVVEWFLYQRRVIT